MSNKTKKVTDNVPLKAPHTSKTVQKAALLLIDWMTESYANANIQNTQGEEQSKRE